MMKKHVPIIVIIFSLIFCVHCVHSYAEYISEPYENGDIDLIAYSGDGYWCVADNELRYRNELTQSDEVIIETSFLGKNDNIISITADGDGVFLCVKNGETAKISQLSKDGSVVREFTLPAGSSIWEMVHVDGLIFALIDYGNSQNPDRAMGMGPIGVLGIVDLQTEKLVRTEIESLIAIGSFDEEHIVALTQSESSYEYHVDKVNVHTLGQVRLYDTISPYRWICGSSKEDEVYLVGNGQVDAINVSENTFRKVLDYGDREIGFVEGIQLVNDSILLNDVINGSLILFKPQPVKNYIYLVNYDGSDMRIEYASKLFSHSHPDYRVITRNLTEEQLIVELMAGGERIDLINLTQHSYATFAKPNILVSLDELPMIMEAMDIEMWLPVRELYDVDGHFYAIPMVQSPTVFTLDKDLYKASGMQWPFSSTWEELRAIAHENGLNSEQKPALYRDLLHFPLVMRQYLSWSAAVHGRIDFDTDEFRSSMETHKNMVKEGLIVSFDDARGSIVCSNTYSVEESDLTRIIPGFGNDDFVPIFIESAIGLNASSTKKELAIEILSMLASPDTQRKIKVDYFSGSLLKDYHLYVNDSFSKYSDIDEEIRSYISSNWVPLYQSAPFGTYCYESAIVSEFVADKISIEVLIRDLQSRIDMTQFEG